MIAHFLRTQGRFLFIYFILRGAQFSEAGLNEALMKRKKNNTKKNNGSKKKKWNN